MNNLQVIDQREVLKKDFKIYGDKENPLFLAKDVSNWIEHSDTSKMLKSIDEEEKVKNIIPTLGGNQEMWFLTEDGLYEVLMQSRKPIAKAFKKEVKNILKQIRQTGGYINIQEDDDAETLMAKALMVAQKTLDKKDKLLKEKDRVIAAQDQVIESKKIELGAKNKFINQIAVSQNSLLVEEVAQIASKEGLRIGRNILWGLLREWGMIKKNTRYDPKQKYIDNGYFEVVEGVRTNRKGVFTYKTTRVLGRGQVYIIERLLKENKEIA